MLSRMELQENNYRNAEGDWVNDRQPLLDAFADGAGAVDLGVHDCPIVLTNE